METMATKVPRTLADEVDRLVASGRYANRSEVLRVAVRALLDSGGTPTRMDPPPTAHVSAFRRRLRELARDRRYRHRWVALHGNAVLDVDEDHDVLVRRILERPEDPIDIGFATDDPTPRRVRLTSPLFVRRT